MNFAGLEQDIVNSRVIGNSIQILDQIDPDGKNEKYLWFNSDGDLIATTPPFITNSPYLQIPAEMRQLFAPAGDYRPLVLNSSSKFLIPLTADGVPMPLPSGIIGVVPYGWGEGDLNGGQAYRAGDQVNPTQEAYILVEQKGSRLRFFIDTSPLVSTTINRYLDGRLTPYVALQMTDFDIHSGINQVTSGAVFGQREDGQWQLTYDAPLWSGKTFASSQALVAYGEKLDVDAQKLDAAAWAESQRQLAIIHAQQQAQQAQQAAAEKAAAAYQLQRAMTATAPNNGYHPSDSVVVNIYGQDGSVHTENWSSSHYRAMTTSN